MIHPFLVTNKLFYYVDGTIPCPQPTITVANTNLELPPTTQPNPNYTWVSNDAHVRMLLLSTISEEAFPHIQGTTSREWLALERAFAPHTISCEYTLKSQLLRIQMKHDESSTDYLTRARSYADALANIGEPVKEKDLVMLVVTGLREEHDGFKSHIVGRSSPTPFSDLFALLADHDYMVKKPDLSPTQAFTVTSSRHSSSPAASSLPADTIQALQQVMSQLGLQVQPQASQQQSLSQPQAFYGARGRGRGSSNRGRGGRSNTRYNNHNNNNFYDSNRNSRGQFNWASNQNNVFGTCNRCGIGHIPSQCPNRDPNTLKTSSPTANFADYRSQASTSWLPDTGCNGHAVMDHTNLDHSEPYYGHVYTENPPHGSK